LGLNQVAPTRGSDPTVRPSLPADHDELTERLVMKHKMACRKLAEQKLAEIRLMKELDQEI
jgi:hypothetical protein